MENWTLTWTKLAELKEGKVNELPGGTTGVYRLSYRSEDGNFYVFYVGQADDIKSRLLEHISAAEENVCIKNYIDKKSCFFRYAIVTKDHIRDAAERQMFKQYEPECNDKEPYGRDDIILNLS